MRARITPIRVPSKLVTEKTKPRKGLIAVKASELTTPASPIRPEVTMMSKYKTLTKVCETNRLHWNRSLMPNMLVIYAPISLNTICHIAEEVQQLTLRQRMELLSLAGNRFIGKPEG